MTAIAQPIQVISSESEDSNAVATVENHIYRFVFDFGHAPAIPRDFCDALADLKAGRIVDLDTALNERPPGV